MNKFILYFGINLKGLSPLKAVLIPRKLNVESGEVCGAAMYTISWSKGIEVQTPALPKDGLQPVMSRLCDSVPVLVVSLEWLVWLYETLFDKHYCLGFCYCRSVFILYLKCFGGISHRNAWVVLNVLFFPFFFIIALSKKCICLDTLLAWLKLCLHINNIWPWTTKPVIKSHGYICSNNQQYIVWVKIIYFSFMPDSGY